MRQEQISGRIRRTDPSNIIDYNDPNDIRIYPRATSVDIGTKWGGPMSREEYEKIMSREEYDKIPEEDIRIVMEKTEMDREFVIEALTASEGNIHVAVQYLVENMVIIEKKEEQKEIEENHIELVMVQTKSSRENAISALKNSGGDVVNAILELSFFPIPNSDCWI
jgi:NACalpha-BTF3-like transcription factor